MKKVASIVIISVILIYFAFRESHPPYAQFKLVQAALSASYVDQLLAFGDQQTYAHDSLGPGIENLIDLETGLPYYDGENSSRGLQFHIFLLEENNMLFIILSNKKTGKIVKRIIQAEY